MNTFTIRQQQNIVSDVIYSIFAYLIRWLWRHYPTKMAASMSAFSSILKSIYFLIYQPIFIFFFSHQTIQLIMLFIFQHVLFAVLSSQITAKEYGYFGNTLIW